MRGIGQCCRGYQLSSGGVRWAFAINVDAPPAGEIWSTVDAGKIVLGVSNHGRVPPSGRITYGVPVCGYLEYQDHRIHRLVARGFLANPLKRPYVNHINGDKADNHVENLEWSTAKENNDHSIETGLRFPGKRQHGSVQ